MAPFPSRRLSKVDTSLSPETYPPPPSKSPPPRSLSGSPLLRSPLTNGFPSKDKDTSNRRPRPAPISTDPLVLFGEVTDPRAGMLGGLGQSWESVKVVRSCLMDNHVNADIYTNDAGFHNHTAHHVLAAYSLGAGPGLLKDIYDLGRAGTKPMPPLQAVDITESNWTEYLGDKAYYPNYLSFFHRLISTPPVAPSPYAGRSSSVVPVLERVLFGGHGEMLARAVSGAIHPLIHIGYGLEFGIDAIVAEGLAQAATTRPGVAALFDFPWPPPASKPTSFQATMTSAFSSLKLGASSSFLGLPPIASPYESFTRTASLLPRRRRIPREGLSGFTILDRILHDPLLGPGSANDEDDEAKLDKTLENQAEEIRAWCDEWKFSVDSSVEYEDEGRSANGNGRNGRRRVPEWEEIVEKTEELIWMATVIYASTTRPGYVNVKLDFFIMHALTSALFLPTILEQVSPHLRPYLLHTHFRVMIAYWISRGRPNLFLQETLLAATATPSLPNVPTFAPGAVANALRERDTTKLADVESPLTPSVGDDGKVKQSEILVVGGVPVISDGEELKAVDERTIVNPWPALIASASDHPDDHLPKVIRALAFAASHFGHSPPGLYSSSLPGTGRMDGSIFIRAAGLTFQALGYAREGQSVGNWDHSGIGFDSTWSSEPHLPGREPKGKGRAVSDDSVVVLSPTTPSVASAHGLDDEPELTTTVPEVLSGVGLGEREPESEEAREERRVREEREEAEHELMG